jgi:hypothetical protein
MGADMHVWVGDEDPFELPLGGVTLFIHQGTPSGPSASGGAMGNTGGPPGAGVHQSSSGTPATLKDPTPGAACTPTSSAA